WVCILLLFSRLNVICAIDLNIKENFGPFHGAYLIFFPDFPIWTSILFRKSTVNVQQNQFPWTTQTSVYPILPHIKGTVAWLGFLFVLRLAGLFFLRQPSEGRMLVLFAQLCVRKANKSPPVFNIAYKIP